MLAGTFAAIALLIVYVAWNSSVEAMDHTVTRMSSSVKLSLESSGTQVQVAPVSVLVACAAGAHGTGVGCSA